MSITPKNPSDSSTSMQSASSAKNEILATSLRPEPSMLTISPEPEVVVLPRSRSRANEVFESHAFRLAWDNDVRNQIARQVFHLRRFRGMSQSAVGEKMGTSQPAIARIEAGEENITATTLQRIIAALRGRFVVAIAPEEMPVQRPTAWWKIGSSASDASTTEWTMRFVAFDRTGDRAVIGMERGTLPSKGLNIVSLGTS